MSNMNVMSMICEKGNFTIPYERIYEILKPKYVVVIYHYIYH